jgi:hypothetical protein
MTALANLHNAVQATLASQRLGRPVFVRYLVQTPDKAETIVPRLAQVTTTVREWLGQPLERLYAVGTVESGQVSLTLQFRDGATALVGFARGQPRGSGIDLMVLANHGAIYHDAGSTQLWDEAVAVAGAPTDARLLAAIERSLRSGKPERVASGGQP